VTSRDSRLGPALAELKPLGKFRTSGYRRVLVGECAPGVGLAELGAGTLATVQRVFVAEQCLAFERDDVTETLCVVLEDQISRFVGKSFFVRANLRGMKGRLETPTVERALGAFLIDACVAAGEPGRVTFDDPDVVLAVETIGSTVAWALVNREERQQPYVTLR
jgi:tRNA(Ser,Leu) C12 N-acetylase TAN1